ncbi:adenylate/guanylate cyclase domain-containing protein [Alkalinema sp. FACHB-956]|uniref:CHASE2 domain-containing protein n=1 Tax=Alkalinema sp. FACHB-956 TaxID=2692768 RepID=UPI00168783B8|nr:adenylate/guanylate cyclase domain-containing protein [Alkalinema sp. FACHB-956]MBD2328579.1 adenylate/guanylate cyclase domain-containing protein [Alkalinema sp. FACHB-956]
MVNRLGKQLWQWRGLWMIIPAVTGAIVLLRALGWLQPLEWMALDQYFRLRPQEPTDDRIVIVGVDEADIQAIGRWPMDDNTLAQVIETIQQQQPRAIGLDFFRDVPVEPGSKRLTQVLAKLPNLIGIEKRLGSQDASAVNPANLLKQKGQTASNNIVADGDGKLRRALLYWTTPDGRESLESLGLRLALMYLDKQGIQPEAESETSPALRLRNAVFPIFEPNDGSYVGADAGGYQILLNYRGPSRTFQTIPMREVLQGKIAGNAFRDRIVLIGPTAESLKDFFYTPYSGNTITTPEKTHGVEIQANVASQVISAALDGRSNLRVWADPPLQLFLKGFPLQWQISEPREATWILLWATIGGLLAWIYRNPRYGILALSVAEGCLFGITYGVFLAGWWIPVVPPALALGLSAIALTGYVSSLERNDRKLVMNLFGRYVTPQIAEAIWRDREQLLGNGRLKGRKMTVTILFTDIKDFSTISERTDPEILMDWLNDYMAAMTQIVLDHGAVVDKFIGDAIMAVFGVPIARTTPQEIRQDALNAVDCAVKMGLALDSLNQKWVREGLPTIQMRVGISTGTAVTGSLGGQQRMDYTAIGDTVNIAARLESFDKSIDGGLCRVLVSDATYQFVQSQFAARSIGSVQLKGREQPTQVYQIVATSESGLVPSTAPE